MKKEDELKFMKLVLDNHRDKNRGEEKCTIEIIKNFKEGKKEDYKTVRDVISNCDIPDKKCHYYLEKWIGNNWYDCGVSADLGWVTEKGEEEMAEVLEGMA